MLKLVFSFFKLIANRIMPVPKVQRKLAIVSSAAMPHFVSARIILRKFIKRPKTKILFLFL